MLWGNQSNLTAPDGFILIYFLRNSEEIIPSIRLLLARRWKARNGVSFMVMAVAHMEMFTKTQ